MPKSPFYTLFFIALFVTQIWKGVSILELNPVKSNESDSIVKRVCEECPEMALEEDLMLMDSEINRRVLLMQKRYISYDTLKRDSVPCDKPGVSYYNCKGPGVANTYHRGCEMITRCARGD